MKTFVTNHALQRWWERFGSGAAHLRVVLARLEPVSRGEGLSALAFFRAYRGPLGRLKWRWRGSTQFALVNRAADAVFLLAFRRPGAAVVISTARLSECVARGEQLGAANVEPIS